MDRPTVLVTGMSGLIGGAVRRQLGARYELRALNRRAVDGVPCHQADIADLAAIEPAFKGVDAVVHLAASVGSSAPFDEILRANVIGTYNVFEASRRAGVRRVGYASSGATVSAYERAMPYRALAHRFRAPRRGGDVPVAAPPPSARWRASRPALASRPAPPMAGKQSELMPTSPSLSREQLVDVELVHDGARVPPGDTLRGRVRRVVVDERQPQVLGAEAVEDRAHERVRLLAVGLVDDRVHQAVELGVADG